MSVNCIYTYRSLAEQQWARFGPTERGFFDNDIGELEDSIESDFVKVGSFSLVIGIIVFVVAVALVMLLRILSTFPGEEEYICCGLCSRPKGSQTRRPEGAQPTQDQGGPHGVA